LRIWGAAAALPFVFLGWAADFWEPFGWYLDIEQGLPATYFIIPFKRRPGERVGGTGAFRRATAYDVTDIRDAVARLIEAGCEIGVHGIDAWHSSDKGREEHAQISAVSGKPAGIRMHWLLHDRNTPSVLDAAGYTYDSTGGYNETVGYRHGTTQVFRPPSTCALLEVPMHIQDGALFFPDRLDLPEDEAWARCIRLIAQTKELGGVLTVLWHDRSHAPERFWGDFYVRLVQELRSSGAWFGSAGQVAAWFGQRRAVRFERTEPAAGGGLSVRSAGAALHPALTLRIHRGSGVASSCVDVPWSGAASVEFDSSLRPIAPDSSRHDGAGWQPRVARGCQT
jgi:hypothetical protein